MTTTKNNEHKELNVPNLRFPEFQGEWKKTTIGDIADLYKGTGISKDQLSDDGEPCILYGELYTKYKSETIREVISKTNIDNTKLVRSKDNDVIIPCSGETAEDIATARCVLNGNILLGGDLNIIRLHGYDGAFMSYQLNGRRKYDIAKVAQGVSVVHLYGEHLKGVKTINPCLEEQKKIAKLLSLLDERIATQNKIIDKLQSLIKGLEDNLLDNPLWEKTYLRSFMLFFPTNSLSWEQLSYKEGGIRNLHYGLIHGFQTRGINSASLPMIKNEAVPKQYILCQVGDVAFADASEDTGEIAKSVEFVNTIEGDTICGLHTIHGRDIKNRTVVGFKGFAFNSRYFHNQIKRLAQGTKVFSITANNLSSCYVYLPDLETQKAIVNLLKTYEAKLLESKRLLEHYEKQKQYFLRQMFI
jgi:type I restriction enzyme, S subunit